jgi:Spy/CpxP family protein refolding chaperone
MRASVLALALLCAGPVFAQSAPSTPSTSAASREAAHMNNLATILDLTDAQKTQVQTILEAEHTQMRQSIGQAMASGTKPDFQQMKALHQQIQQQTLQKLSTVLSATQLKKFQALSEMNRHGHFHHGGAPGNTATPASSS